MHRIPVKLPWFIMARCLCQILTWMAWYPMAKHRRVKITPKATSYSAFAFQASPVRSTIDFLSQLYMYNKLDREDVDFSNA